MSHVPAFICLLMVWTPIQPALEDPRPFSWGTSRSFHSVLWLLQWAELREQGGPPRAGVDRPGPRLYEPAGKRFLLLQGDSPTSRVFQ